MSMNPGESDSNNPGHRSSQNKPQLLEATMRNVPKLKELNYAQWKNIITNSIKRAKLWDYVDGSIEEPSEHDASRLTTYYDEAAAVRNAILGSLESGAQKYIEEAFDPRDSWLALEKKYLTAEADADANLVSIEQQLANLRLEEGGDMIEHIAEFCRMRSQLSGTHLAIDDQACIIMLYRSLPSSYRQSVLTPEGTEMKDFNALCARLTYLSQNPKPEAPIDDTPPAPTEDHTEWGVPEDIKAFGLTGSKNPLLEERAAVTCRDCLLKDHKSGTPECPQYEWRKELWGVELSDALPGTTDAGRDSFSERPLSINTKRLSYEFSEPVKVVLKFDELTLKPELRKNLSYPQPSAIQQCAILPIIQGRNVLAQAPHNNGKTTALAVSILQAIDTSLSHAQALVFTSTCEAARAFQKTVNALGLNWFRPIQCYACDYTNPLAGSNLAPLAGINNHQIFVGTPDYLLRLARRNIINMRKLRIVVLDDIDKLIEVGTEDQILEVYRHLPPLAQVVASSSTYSSSTAKSIAKLLADPLEVFVGRNEGMSIGTHFYVTVSAKQKIDVLYTSFSTLYVTGAVLLCRDIPEFPGPRSTGYGYYYLRESMEPHERRNVIQGFTSAATSLRSRSTYSYDTSTPVSKVGLVIPDTALSTAGLSNIGVPLINYDVPNNVEDYVKRLEQWRVADPGQSQMIITFVTADTDEINVLRDLERRYGVHVAELLWEGGRLQ
ncbi:hypothetical protein RSAG8_03531, partial [Rhizoctonia solani AG-8 WAC10335]